MDDDVFKDLEPPLCQTIPAPTHTFVCKQTNMKGITILEDRANKKRYLQIDLADLDKRREQIEDMLDGLIAEQRAGQPTVSLDQLEKKLRKQGKL